MTNLGIMSITPHPQFAWVVLKVRLTPGRLSADDDTLKGFDSELSHQCYQHDRVTASDLDQRSSRGRCERVEHAEADHHVPDVADAVRATHERLTNENTP